MSNTSVAQMIQQLQDESRLSKWEMGFLESVSEQWEDKGHISKKTQDTLEKIFERYNN